MSKNMTDREKKKNTLICFGFEGREKKKKKAEGGGKKGGGGKGRGCGMRGGVRRGVTEGGASKW